MPNLCKAGVAPQQRVPRLHRRDTLDYALNTYFFLLTSGISASASTPSPISHPPLPPPDFSGFEVGSGSGTVYVETEALGATRLAVRIGDNAPSVVSAGGRKNLYVGYDVAEPTYVYVYAISPNASSAKAWRVPQVGENALLIYGIKIIPSNSGDAIREIESGQLAIGNDALWFDLSGKPTAKPRQSGIYIKNGKKIVVK